MNGQIYDVGEEVGCRGASYRQVKYSVKYMYRSAEKPEKAIIFTVTELKIKIRKCFYYFRHCNLFCLVSIERHGVFHDDF